jgi:hypothetical protein
MRPRENARLESWWIFARGFGDFTFGQFFFSPERGFGMDEPNGDEIMPLETGGGRRVAEVV